MTKKKLEKEACNWLRKYLLCCNCENKCNCIDSNSYCEKQVLKAYVDSAEPREKRIVELERKLEQTEKDLADYQFNYTTIKELQKENTELKSIADFQQGNNMDRHFQLKRSKDQLTKAKELLENVYKIAMGDWNDSKWHDQVLRKAKQFLKEVSE